MQNLLLARHLIGRNFVNLTVLDHQTVAVRAINEGHVFSFLNKPVALDALQAGLDNALAHRRIRKNGREFIDRTVNDIVLS